MRQVWTRVDEYFEKLLAPTDLAHDGALLSNAKAGMPPHDVSPLQGKFLQTLVLMTGAQRILEIGTLGGYSAIWFARGLGPDGKIISLEVDPHRAEIACANFERAGCLDQVDLRVGPALESLPLLEEGGYGPFDLIFIDADKSNNPDYLKWALRLSRPGTVIVGDNVVRGGKVIEEDSQDLDVRGVCKFVEMVAAEPRLRASVIQTVGAKGYDGFLFAVVVS